MRAARTSVLTVAAVTTLVAGMLTAGAVVAGAADATTPSDSGPCVDSTTADGTLATCTFDVGATTWTVPDDILAGSALTIQATGQAGQRETSQIVNSRGGGRGASVTADFVMPAGTVLQLSRPGYAGDGAGAGFVKFTSAASGSGGGRATVARVDSSGGGTSIKTLIVAGGGGGEGYGSRATDESGNYVYRRGGIGGDAGLPSAPAPAADGGEGDGEDLPGGGGGAGSSTGGTAGARGGYTGSQNSNAYNILPCTTLVGSVPGLSGGLEYGGAAQPTYTGIFGAPGGGGGGGLAGGGSGGAGSALDCSTQQDGDASYFSGGGGGGGGSSYVDAGALNPSASLSNLPYEDAGALVISYNVDSIAPVPTLTAVTSPRSTPVPEISWDYGEATNEFPQFELTLDGTPVTISATGLTFSLDNRTGGVSLQSSTDAPGTYVFTLFAAGIHDIAGNAVPSDVSVTWTKRLTGALGPVLSPRTTGVGTIPVTFSGPVTGVDLSDIQVFRDGVPITSPSEYLSGSGADYVLGGLDDLTAPGATPATYEVYLDAADSGIVDGSYALADDLDLSFTVDRSTPPTASFAPVSSPRAAGPDSIALTFSQPVYAVDISDFRIFRDGIATPLTGATLTSTGTLPDGASASYVIGNLAALTSPELYPVSWELDLKGSGTSINNEQDILLVSGTSVAFQVLSAPAPTATIESVPSPRADGVDQLAVTFSQTVFAVDASDFRLYRDGILAPLGDATLTGHGADYVLGNLDDDTAPELYPVNWEVTLVADGSNITDDEGVEFAQDASTSFDVGAAPAPVGTFATVTTPRSGPVDTIGLVFTAPVDAVDVGDFTLTRDGADVPLDGVTLTGSGADYQLGGLTPLTVASSQDDDYTMTLNDSGTGITSDRGVPLAAGSSVSFVVQARTVSIPATITLTDDARNSLGATIVKAALTTGTSGAPAFTGTVSFSISPGSGPAVTCTAGDLAPIVRGHADCILPLRMTHAGNADFVVTAAYYGDANFLSTRSTIAVRPPGTPTTLSLAKSTSHNGQRVFLTLSVEHAATADLLRGRGAIAVFDSSGQLVPCDRFWHLRTRGTFGCTITDAASKGGVYTVLGVFYSSRVFYRSYLYETVVLP